VARLTLCSHPLEPLLRVTFVPTWLIFSVNGATLPENLTREPVPAQRAVTAATSPLSSEILRVPLPLT
jgi:hypothetical protein